MRITKFGQCCLLIEVAGKRILTDPGRFTSEQNSLTNLDIILITHEHADHLHTESLNKLMQNNPDATIVTNSAVAKLLAQQGIECTLLEGRNNLVVKDIYMEAFDGKHEEIFEEVGQVQNTGYFIGEDLFYPGDAYTEPRRPVKILALPVAGPWCKLADALRYAIAVAPEKAFPVHDWLLNEDGMTLVHNTAETQLSTRGIDFIKMSKGEVKEF